jgi:hypothetical protein
MDIDYFDRQQAGIVGLKPDDLGKFLTNGLRYPRRPPLIHGGNPSIPTRGAAETSRRKTSL